MKDLDLPSPETPLPRGKPLSMDEYLRFVQMQQMYEFERSPKSGQPRPTRQYERFRLN